MYVRSKTPTFQWQVGVGGATPVAEQRRPIADTAQCLKCHVGSLYQHGNTRVDNVDLCVMCHNAASSEQNVRTQMGVVASEAYDGKVGQTYEMKSMLHMIHSAGGEGQRTIAIYRTRGIFAWAQEGVTPANWPGAACQVVSPVAPATTPAAYVDVAPFEAIPAGMAVTLVANIVNGANTNTDGTYPTVACQTHTLYHPTYPRPFNDCLACHDPDFETIPDQSQAVATTFNAGATPWANQLDDTLGGPATTACTTCHQSSSTVGHAYQNSWTPQTFPNGRQTVLDAAQ
jgi:hypothetical protein